MQTITSQRDAFYRESRLASLVREPRWNISPQDEIDLAIYFDQKDLNSVAGLNDLLDYALRILEVEELEFVAEVGSHYGVSTECIALVSKNLTAIDPWEDEAIYSSFLRRIHPYPHVSSYREYSPKAADMFQDGQLDLVYIDAMHTQPEVEADIRAWLPKVRPGGFIAGHDYIDYTGCKMEQYIQVIPALNNTIGKPDALFSDSSWIKRL